MEKTRIVGIGGGTGLPVLLAGLRSFPHVDVSAIVTVADNGGSSGRLRDSFGIPAVGDLRNCLVALSGSDCSLAGLFQHRFPTGDSLSGHALGNLIVTALYQQTGSLKQALEAAGAMLPTKGLALAATEVPATLCAAFEDGTIARGESQVSSAGKIIERVWLEPENPPPSPGVLEAIHSADAIVLAPGSLYTSLAPNLLVRGVAEAIRESRATKILVCNLTTQPGETDGFTASGHLQAIESLLGPRVVEFVLMNSATERVRALLSCDSRSEPVTCDAQAVRMLGAVSIKEDLLAEDLQETPGREIRHDSGKLARVILSLARATRQERPAPAPAKIFHFYSMRPRHRGRKGRTSSCRSGYATV